MSVMRACGGCGDWVGDAATTCPRCGADVTATAAAQPPPPPPQAPPQWAPPLPVEMLAFYAHDSEYGLIVHTKKGAGDVMKEFKESLQISGG
jgi:hypothetical protein